MCLVEVATSQTRGGGGHHSNLAATLGTVGLREQTVPLDRAPISIQGSSWIESKIWRYCQVLQKKSQGLVYSTVAGRVSIWYLGVLYSKTRFESQLFTRNVLLKIMKRRRRKFLEVQGYKLGVQAPQAKIFRGTGVQIRGTSRRRRNFLGVQGYKIGVQIGF